VPTPKLKANSFLSILRGNDGVLDASQLFSQLRPKVMVNSDQTPEYGDIQTGRILQTQSIKPFLGLAITEL